MKGKYFSSCLKSTVSFISVLSNMLEAILYAHLKYPELSLAELSTKHTGHLSLSLSQMNNGHTAYNPA